MPGLADVVRHFGGGVLFVAYLAAAVMAAAWLVRSHDPHVALTLVIAGLLGVTVFVVLVGLEMSFDGYWTGDATTASRLAKLVDPFPRDAALSVGASVVTSRAVLSRLVRGWFPLWLGVPIGIAGLGMVTFVGSAVLRSALEMLAVRASQ
jgi:hypothetical protein